jgi:hypothetical protein
MSHFIKKIIPYIIKSLSELISLEKVLIFIGFGEAIITVLTIAEIGLRIAKAIIYINKQYKEITHYEISI